MSLSINNDLLSHFVSLLCRTSVLLRKKKGILKYLPDHLVSSKRTKRINKAIANDEEYVKEIKLGIKEWLKNSHLPELDQQRAAVRITQLENEYASDQNNNIDYLFSFGIGYTQNAALGYVEGCIERAPADASCVLASYIAHELSGGGKNRLGEINHLNEHYVNDIRWFIIAVIEFTDFLRGTQLTDPIEPDRLSAFIPKVKNNTITAIRHQLVSSVYLKAAGHHDSTSITTKMNKWREIRKKLNCSAVSTDPIYQEMKSNLGAKSLKKPLKYTQPKPVSKTTLMRHLKAISPNPNDLSEDVNMHVATVLIYTVDAVQKSILANTDLNLEQVVEYFAGLPDMHCEFRKYLISHAELQSNRFS